jgi:DNA modification methylase
MYSNHSKIIQKFMDMGFQVFPEILWRKPSNKPNKFLGSGMLPPNAYVSQEHEYILIFRKGGNRHFSKKDNEVRYRSSYFWEERNKWFSDVWTDLQGIKQNLIDNKVRKRSGAYPFELTFRLINMFSVQGDVVLDPFLGTGTTTLGAIASARNSVGYEIEDKFKPSIEQTIENAIPFMNSYIQNRMTSHRDFVLYRKEKGKEFKYKGRYGEVITSQEEQMIIYNIRDLKKENKNPLTYVVDHQEYNDWKSDDVLRIARYFSKEKGN